MSTINERIGKILSCTGMTKTAFAERLSVSQQYISKVVKSGNPSDMLIAAICHEFNVSEHWLRTGEGEMFVQIARDKEIMRFVGDVMQGEDDNFRRRFLLALARLPEERWADIESFAQQITAENKKEEQD